MNIRRHNAEDAPEPIGDYPQALECSGATRRVYISGQIPLTKEGDLPDSFEAQADQAWANVIAQLNAADMGVENLVKATVFLSDRKYALENRRARQRALGSHCPALSIVIAGIFDETWLLEIEAIAEA